jgi:hypothetical protein
MRDKGSLFIRDKYALSVPRHIPGVLLARSGQLFDSPSRAQIVEQLTAGTDLYFGIFQQRGVTTRLRRADTQGDKIYI